MTKSNIFALVTLFAIFGIAVTNAFHKYGPEFMDDDHPKFLFKPASVDVQGKRYIFKFGNIEYAGGMIYSAKRGYYVFNKEESVRGGFPNSEGTTGAARYIEIIVDSDEKPDVRFFHAHNGEKGVNWRTFWRYTITAKNTNYFGYEVRVFQ